MNTHDKKPNCFSCLAGEELTAVCFVMDYLQLQFNGYLMNVLTPLEVVSGKDSYSLAKSGYRDALCEQIARKVADTVLDEDYLRIVFEDNSCFNISLKPEDYTGAEAINFFFPDSDNRPITVI